ncbi:MAG: MFS transporter [Candidatus Nanopelagicales bacterium]|nr:MFS transporter [Candidatus Nanopelagicales bacterium]
MTSWRPHHLVQRSPLFRDLPVEVAVLSVISFFVAIGFGILAPAIPVFARSFGVTALEASAVISGMALTRFLMSPLSGMLANRWGERIILSTGLILVAVTSLAAGLSQTYLQLLFWRGITGIGSSMFTVSAMALLLRVSLPDQRGRAASAFQGGFLLGGVAGPAFGGLIVAWSIRAPFFIYAGSLAVASVVSMVFLSKAHLRERETLVSEGEAEAQQTLRSAMRDGAYRASLIVNFVSGFVSFGMRISIVPLFITEGLQRGASLAGFGFLLAAVVQAILLMPAGRVADTQGRRKALRIGSIGLTVGMVVLTLADILNHGFGTASIIGPALFFLSMAIQGVSAAFLGSAPAAVVGDIVGGRRGGIVIATFQMTSDLGMILGPLAAGALVDLLDFDWAFGVGAVLSLVALVAVWLMPETLNRTRPTQAAMAQ